MLHFLKARDSCDPSHISLHSLRDISFKSPFWFSACSQSWTELRVPSRSLDGLFSVQSIRFSISFLYLLILRWPPSTTTKLKLGCMIHVPVSACCSAFITILYRCCPLAKLDILKTRTCIPLLASFCWLIVNFSCFCSFVNFRSSFVSTCFWWRSAISRLTRASTAVGSLTATVL